MSAYPIIPWIGGKRKLADRLIHLFPPHTCYVEVFAGAAAVFFAKRPPKSKCSMMSTVTWSTYTA